MKKKIHGGTEMAMEPYWIPTKSTQKPYTSKQNKQPANQSKHTTSKHGTKQKASEKASLTRHGELKHLLVGIYGEGSTRDTTKTGR